MRPSLLTLILFAICSAAYSQKKNPIGVFANSFFPRTEIAFFADSTFEYTSDMSPVFYFDSRFSAKGIWTTSGDTIILNKDLELKPLVQSVIVEEESGDSMVKLTFNHIKRYYNREYKLVRSDTLQIRQLDFAFNELRKKKLTRVAANSSVRCTFAGYIPKETITSERSIYVNKPSAELRRIFIGCYELQGTKEFAISNPHANRFTMNVFSNYYEEGLIRHMRLLFKNKDVLYTQQKPNGEFVRDNIWIGVAYYSRLKRMKAD